MTIDSIKRRIRRTYGNTRRSIGNRVALARAQHNAPRIFTDACGFRFVFQPWMRDDAKPLLERRGTSGQWAAIAQLIEPGDTVFDVGAHAGRFSAFVDPLVGDTGRVFAFEPVPESYWMLRENLVLNRCTRVIATQAAVGRATGRATMHLFPRQFSSWNSLGRPTMKTMTGQRLVPIESVQVPCLSLDAFCTEQAIERIDFLKVDVEGFERDVFLGASRLLGQGRIGRICFEISQDPLKGAGLAARDVFETLERFGYGVYAFDDAANRFTGPCHNSDEYWANYYASTESLTALPTQPTALQAAA